LTSFVLDASVAVASLHPNEPGHAAARSRLQPVLAGVESIVVPAIFRVEVSSALARKRWEPIAIERFVDVILRGAQERTIGPRAAHVIARIAMRTRLRAADAAYVWVASRAGLPLVTADQEILARAVGHCQALPP
jgi:predicted nucleic acid-binding protein